MQQIGKGKAGESPRLTVFQTADLPEVAQAVVDRHVHVIKGDWTGGLRSLQHLTPVPDAILCSISDMRFDRAAIFALPAGIRALATYSVGLDHIDLKAAEERGLAVFNTPGALQDSVADAAMLLMLGAVRRGAEAMNLLASGAWTGWTADQLLGFELRGKTLGILGMGAIGREVALRAASFGMRLAYSNRKPAASVHAGSIFVRDADDLVACSDVLLLACPSTPATRGFLDRRRLELARRNLVAINIGRGDLVDDEALIGALQQRRIFAAGLDVFNNEPALDPRYLDLPNVFLTPHIGSSTVEARVRMAEVLVTGMASWAAGGQPTNRVV